MTTTKIFRNNKTQAVRLPRAVAFPEDVTEVEILVEGEARIIVPAGYRLDFFFARRDGVSDDFMVEREQPSPQERARL